MEQAFGSFLPISRLVQNDCVMQSRVDQFNAQVKCSQLENSLSYCTLRIELCRSEQASKQTPSPMTYKRNRPLINHSWWVGRCLGNGTVSGGKSIHWPHIQRQSLFYGGWQHNY